MFTVVHCFQLVTYQKDITSPSMTSNPWENVQLALSLLCITILSYGSCARALESYLWFLGGHGEQGLLMYILHNIYVCVVSRIRLIILYFINLP